MSLLWSVIRVNEGSQRSGNLKYDGYNTLILKGDIYPCKV
ncbi:hypothetical protein EDF73_113109 [Raoultella sp. BIGb0138]|nr:hypothetical protein EDF73_113109 [Raoultella sp. BIGb0138]